LLEAAFLNQERGEERKMEGVGGRRRQMRRSSQVEVIESGACPVVRGETEEEVDGRMKTPREKPSYRQ
jgi:hypothetical protein